jgi:predicted ester cyclase
MLPALKDAIPDRHLEIEELVGEGNAVVARFTFNMTFASGKKISARGIPYYRLADGKIVENDPMTPDLMQKLDTMMQARQ